MAILKTCCCWCNVRGGSIACGIYTLLLALVNGGLTSYNLLHHSYLLIGNRTSNGTGESIAYDAFPATDKWFLVILILCVLLLVTSVVLIIGVRKDNRFMLLPWIIVVVMTIILDTAALIYQCIVLGLLTYNIIQIIIWLALTMLNIYCLLCVVSQYQELRAGRGTLEYLHAQRMNVHYRPGIQEVHFTQGPIFMPYPGHVTSTIHASSSDQEGAPPCITMSTSVVMAPPDYHTAAGSPPQYEASERAHLSNNDPFVSDKNTRRKESDSSSPPPYSP